MKGEAIMKREVMQELIDKRQEQRADIYSIQRQSETEFTINGHKYVLLSEYRDAFQTEKLEERFSSILSKYDYIVGDWGFDQLRLKGFFSPENPLSQKTTSVDTIQDYLYEYCNFGCAYFVIKNLEVKIPKPEHQSKKPTHKRSSNNNNRSQAKTNVKNTTVKHTSGNTTGHKKNTNNANNKNNAKSQKPRVKNTDPKGNNQNQRARNTKPVKPQIKERETKIKTTSLGERKDQTATRVAGNQKTKQKFVIRHK